MMETFVDKGDKKLGRGEVDAIAGFIGGISKRSLGAAGVRDRILDIYRNTEFSTGQRAWFLQGLERAGFTEAELEGVNPNTAEGFAMMSHTAQADHILELANRDGVVSATTPGRAAAGARTQILKAIEAYKERYAEDHGIDLNQEEPFEGETWERIFLEEDTRGRGKGHVGYRVELHIYHSDHQVDEMLYFNRKGEFLVDRYHGE